MSKILLIGNDLQLLTTRAAVLAKTCTSVVFCDALETGKALESETFDLVVLCHSLSEGQLNEITEIVHRRLPKVRILMVVSDALQERSYKGIEFNATSSSEPNRLIRRTTELLEGLPDMEETKRVMLPLA